MLNNKNIVITGAGSGIGRATSLLAARYGANVCCVSILPTGCRLQPMKFRPLAARL